ncbi:hypothetical protein EV184_1355 [Sinorhizobium americanum]|uniref:Uncharacterized protein n=1 Tax=Sinorhizobium americanum TaxID=194963 RepID=A0A4R2AWB6_9HYPH|nr:hypothetical protein EV184_1355 [Sinorhizobium americanum]
MQVAPQQRRPLPFLRGQGCREILPTPSIQILIELPHQEAEVIMPADYCTASTITNEGQARSDHVGCDKGRARLSAEGGGGRPPAGKPAHAFIDLPRPISRAPPRRRCRVLPQRQHRPWSSRISYGMIEALFFAEHERGLCCCGPRLREYSPGQRLERWWENARRIQVAVTELVLNTIGPYTPVHRHCYER